MRTALCLLVVVIGTSGGELSVSHAMKRTGEPAGLALKPVFIFLRRALRERWLWLGIALLATGFFALLTLLSWEAVSFAIPATALSYVVGALGAKLLLGERLAPVRWIGIVLVSFGVALVSLGG